jgi:hypothetical protein
MGLELIEPLQRGEQRLLDEIAGVVQIPRGQSPVRPGSSRGQ